MVNGYTFNRILACELWCNKCDLTPNGGSRWWKLQRSMRLLYVKLVKAGIGVRWMKCQGCRFVSSTFSEAKPPKPIQKLIIESYVFGLLLCCLTPEWTPSMTQSILANSPDVQPSCLFCFFVSYPHVGWNFFPDFPRVYETTSYTDKNNLLTLGSKRLQLSTTWVVVSNIVFFYPENWGNDPIWLIFFKWVQTNN